MLLTYGRRTCALEEIEMSVAQCAEAIGSLAFVQAEKDQMGLWLGFLFLHVLVGSFFFPLRFRLACEKLSKDYHNHLCVVQLDNNKGLV